MNGDKIRIEEIIIVEGRDDTAAVKRAVKANTIETHGFGMSDEMWRQADTAYKNRGIIVFTDPDRAGENIRRKLKERYPGCKEAFLPQSKALKNGDLGIENADPESIAEALLKAKHGKSTSKNNACEAKIFTAEDMESNGLSSGAGSRKKREKIGAVLGIGYGNTKAFLAKLNGYGITREEFYGAIRSIGDTWDKE